MLYLMAQEVMEHFQAPGLEESFLDLWQDDFLQAMGWVARCSLCWLNVEPYSQALFK